MCRPLYWFWGLIPLALVMVLALYFRPTPIEADLASRTNAALVEAGEVWASIAIDGRDVSLTGSAPNEAAKTQAREIAQSVWGVHEVNDNTELLALADPFLWRAERDAGTLSLSGNIPSAEARGGLEATANQLFEGVTLNSDGLTAARGVPDLAQWTAGTEFALEQLAKLEAGVAALENLDLTLSGIAPSPEVYEEVLGALETLPDGITLAENGIEIPTVSPHRFTVEREEGRLNLTGFAPSFEARAVAVSEADRLFPEASIESDIAVAGGGVDAGRWSQGATYLLGQLARLRVGNGEISDNSITVTGEAATIAGYEEARAALDAVPAPFTLSGGDIAPAPADSFTWTAAIDQETVSIGGFAPTEEVVGRIAEAAEAALPNREIRTTTQVAAGPVESVIWGDRAGYSLGLLKGLEQGRVLLTPSGLSVDGRAASVVDYEAIKDALAALPEGLELVRDGVLPAVVTPFVWSATVDGTTIETAGFAPTEDLRNELVGALSDAKSGAEVVSTVRIANGDVSAPAYSSAVELAARMVGLLSEGSVSLSDSTLSVDGTAADVESFDAANALIASIPEGLTEGTIDIRPAAIGVLSWSATREGRRIELDGSVPSEAIRKGILDAAAAEVSGANIIDNMEIGDGGAEAAIWGNGAAFALRQLGRLIRGRVALNGTDFAIDGVAPDFDAYNAVLGDVPGAIPGGLRLASRNILPPAISPYVWGARRDGVGMALTGHVPDTETRDEVVAFAQRQFGSVPVADTMTLASGAPVGLIDGIGVGLTALQNLSAGSVALLDRKMTVRGVADNASVRDRVVELLTSGLPEGYESIADIRVQNAGPAPVAADECQSLLNEILSGNIIRFEVNSADLREESFTVLDRLLETAERCPESRIEIAGHTDADGSDEYNRRLSQSRAEAVRRYLVDGGVGGDRLTARGYGEAEPIASNDTDAGKARNRRIEFNILQ
ncbi:MAG: OmpA family protein [Pseudomonadota bacterium]